MTDQKYYTRTFRVRWSEVNAVDSVGLATYLRYIVETAWDWGATGGLGASDNEALGLAWVVRETELTFQRPLHANDVFDFTIWLLDWRRVRGTRCFELRLADGGALVAQGSQQIVTLDSQTLRPARLPPQLLANFLFENPRVITRRKFPKFGSPPASALTTTRAVKWGDIDGLQHVNNAVYATFAEDAVAEALASFGWPPARFEALGLAFFSRRFHILYQAPAVLGETLRVAIYLTELTRAGGAWHIDMVRAGDDGPLVREVEPIVQCVLEWAVVDRANGELAAPPSELISDLSQL